MLAPLKDSEVWFVTGSQHLYGPETLALVAEHSQQIAAALDEAPAVPVRIVFKPVLTGSDGIRRWPPRPTWTRAASGSSPGCTRSRPAKMWIAGLELLAKPFLHLHTQFNREIPWADIDMDFMNLNQSAHGDREFGFIAPAAARAQGGRRATGGARARRRSGPGARGRVRAGTTADATDRPVRRQHARGRGHRGRQGRGAAEARVLGQQLGRGGPGGAGRRRRDADVDDLVTQYVDEYDVADELRPGGDRADSLRDGARIELGLRRFLAERELTAFTDTFEDLHGLKQLPGLAVQRLMAEGYGFGAEGDWKTAAHGAGDEGDGGRAAGRHVVHGGLHVPPATTATSGAGRAHAGNCPSIAGGRPRLEVHPLSIGGKEDPVRLVFDAHPGPAVDACGHRHGHAVPDGRPRRSTSSRRRSHCPSCRSRGPSGARAPTCERRRGLDPRRRLAPHQLSQAVTREQLETSPRWRAWSCW